MGFDFGHTISSLAKIALRTMRTIDKNNVDEKQPDSAITGSTETEQKNAAAKNDFPFWGKGNCIRPREECNKINTQAADEAFKKCKKEMLDVFMKEKGFLKYRTTGYLRLNKIGLVESINLQKEAYGSKTFTLNIYMIPIYVPHDSITIGFGDRIGCLVANRDFWWDFKDFKTAEHSFENVIFAIDQYILPWYEKYQSEETYMNDLSSGKYRLGITRLDWIVFIYLKHNDLEGAKTYLSDFKKTEQYLGEGPSLRKTLDERIKKLTGLVNSIEDAEEYIDGIILGNIEKHRFPQKFKSAVEKDGATR